MAGLALSQGLLRLPYLGKSTDQKGDPVFGFRVWGLGAQALANQKIQRKLLPLFLRLTDYAAGCPSNHPKFKILNPKP